MMQLREPGHCPSLSSFDPGAPARHAPGLPRRVGRYPQPGRLLAALLASPVIGVLNDRMNRVSALIVGMSLAAVGYIAFGLQENPLAGSGIPLALILGVGQISAILAGTTLIGQEADPHIRGATIGVWNFCGAIGTVVGSLLGGLLFDWWMPGAPFLLMGMLNLGVAAAAIWCRLKHPGDSALQVASSRGGAL